ncbi:hypothetical protein [Mesorhizobium sp. M1396]|uniref:hypothetical protein n=1 Tax=Mesorhizobium sp. M1396 TaxID=2957095 RepID=UPI0033354E42
MELQQFQEFILLMPGRVRRRPDVVEYARTTRLEDTIVQHELKPVDRVEPSKDSLPRHVKLDHSNSRSECKRKPATCRFGNFSERHCQYENVPGSAATTSKSVDCWGEPTRSRVSDPVFPTLSDFSSTLPNSIFRGCHGPSGFLWELTHWLLPEDNFGPEADVVFWLCKEDCRRSTYWRWVVGRSAAAMPERLDLRLGLVDSFAGKIGAYLVKDWWMALVSRFEILDTSETTVQLSIEMWYDSPHGEEEEEGKAGD